MSQRALARIEGNNIQLKIEYNRKAIAVLKEMIPPELRSYDADTGVWTIDRSRESQVRELLEQFYPEVNQRDIRIFGKEQ